MIKIFIFGFEKLGFKIPQKKVKMNRDVEIEFIPFDSNRILSEADGIIIPQGIFEKNEVSEGFYGKHNDIVFDKATLLQRERELLNLTKRNKWICFLVGKVIDYVRVVFNSYPRKDTDLCKKFLNLFQISRDIIKSEEPIIVNSKNDAFNKYIIEYGIPKTYFNIYNNNESKTIASSEDYIGGFEISNNVFFLPFHTTNKNSENLEKIVKILINSIYDYREKHLLNLPEWLNKMKFDKEMMLEKEIEEIIKKGKTAKGKLEKWKNYKGILTSSGDILKNIVVRIFSDYFQLKLDSFDEFKEDAKVLDEEDNIITFIEIKGTKKGIKREYINQVDSHRERAGFKTDIPGILIINNEMSKEGYHERIETKVSDEHIKHANNLNVLIVRTIDLLLLMKQLEKIEISEIKEIILSIISSGGGWLKAEEKKYDILS